MKLRIGIHLTVTRPGSRDYQVNGQKPTMLHTTKGHVQNDNCTPGLHTPIDTMQGFR
jgi:hypothetical protein